MRRVGEAAGEPTLAPSTEACRRHPVLDVLRARLDARCRPGRRRDGHRVGLAVEGGAVRGAVSAGMLAALEELGLRDAFDAVYGSSAGSLNAAYFLAGQAWEAPALYLDQVSDGHVIRFRRALRRSAVIDLDHVLDQLMAHRLPLDWDAVIASPIRLGVVASSVTELRPVMLTEFATADELRTALRAGATIPLLAGPPVEFRGHRLLDAAVIQPHPYEAAVADGCTHVLSLSTRPRGRKRGAPGPLDRLVARRLDRLGTGLGSANLRRLTGYRDAQLRLAALSEHPADPPHVLDVAPPAGCPEVPRLTRDVARVLAGACGGYEAVMLEVASRRVHAVLRLTTATNGP